MKSSLPILLGFFVLFFFVFSGHCDALCNGTIADCYEGEEMLMESEISRRFLAENGKRISYGSLRNDQPACGSGGRGEPYSKSCLPEKSNSGGKGCYKIYRCRDGS
ncbi:hypothetical protein ACHQM5_027953 [Ranunculus cassubicifolius]